MRGVRSSVLHFVVARLRGPHSFTLLRFSQVPFMDEHTVDVLVVMQRQALVIQKAQKTVDIDSVGACDERGLCFVLEIVVVRLGWPFVCETFCT